MKRSILALWWKCNWMYSNSPLCDDLFVYISSYMAPLFREQYIYSTLTTLQKSWQKKKKVYVVVQGITVYEWVISCFCFFFTHIYVFLQFSFLHSFLTTNIKANKQCLHSNFSDGNFLLPVLPTALQHIFVYSKQPSETVSSSLKLSYLR